MSELSKSQWIETFRAAREILTTKGWSQGAFARGPNRIPCHIEDGRAASFCLLGSVGRALYDQRLSFFTWRTRTERILSPFIPDPDATRGYDTIPAFNDQSTIEDVLALLDNAVKTLEKENESPHE